MAATATEYVELTRREVGTTDDLPAAVAAKVARDLDRATELAAQGMDNSARAFARAAADAVEDHRTW